LKAIAVGGAEAEAVAVGSRITVRMPDPSLAYIALHTISTVCMRNPVLTPDSCIYTAGRDISKVREAPGGAVRLGLHM
jgi:hypothetical protein